MAKGPADKSRPGVYGFSAWVSGLDLRSRVQGLLGRVGFGFVLGGRLGCGAWLKILRTITFHMSPLVSRK